MNRILLASPTPLHQSGSPYESRQTTTGFIDYSLITNKHHNQLKLVGVASVSTIEELDSQDFEITRDVCWDLKVCTHVRKY
jgi:hypothetical protein